MRKLFFFRSSQDSSIATNGKVHKEPLKHVGGVIDDVSEVKGSQFVKDNAPRQEKQNFSSFGSGDILKSPVGRNHLDDRSNWSRDILKSPVGRNHLDDRSNCEVTPERQLKIKTSSKLKRNSQGQEARDSGHPSSRSYSGSAGSSPYSSPMPVRCRSARFTHASSGTLDLYIDGEQQYDRDIRPSQDSFEYTCAGEDGVLVENRPFKNVGRPPRCQVSSGLDSSGNNKKVSRSHSFREFRDVGFPFSSRDRVESLPSSSPNHDLVQNVDGRLWNVLPRKSRLKLQEVDAETYSTLDEDGDSCLKKHPLVGPYSYVPEHEQSFDHSQISRTNMNNSSSEHMSYPSNDLVGPKQTYPVYQGQEEETEATKLENFHDRDEQLLEECKAAEERLAHVSDEFEQHVQSRELGSDELIHMVKILNSERRKLAAEIVEQMQRRMMEREYMKNTIEMAKIEHEALVRKIEKEKNEIQSCLERELDRRSGDWSSKHEKFKQEEKRLRERVRDLAEQNVSLQREVVSLSSKEIDNHAKLENKELQLGDLKKKLEESMLEVSTVRQSLIEMEEQCKETEAERDLIGRNYNKKEIESKDLQRVVVRLQKTCSAQEKTINGLRLNLNIEIGKAAFDKDDYVCKLHMEELRLTGLEQTLRKELDSSRIEIEMLRKENIGLLERLQTTGNGGGSATVKLDQELHARTESLQDQGLFLLDQSCSMCDELLDYIKIKLHDSYSEQDRPLGDGNHQVASYSFLEIDLKLQRLKQEIESFKRSLQITSGFLHERFNLAIGDYQSQLSNVDENEPKRGLKLHKSQVNTCFELEAEVLVAKVLREKLWSKEVELEHLQTELASSVRLHDILKSEIQRTQDSLSCLTHKVKDLELEVGRKNETVNKLEMEAQNCQKELAALKGILSQVSKERDLMWEQVKEYSEKNMLQNYELDTLRKKIEALDEEILLKEGQITILKDSINDRPCEILYSPKSSQDFSIGELSGL